MHLIPGKGTTAASVKVRLDSVDMLRGLVILIMALDHVREYLSIVKGIDTSSMTPAYFFTRWITHFCAPAFCFLAGTSAYLSLGGGRRMRLPMWVEGIRFLATGGLSAVGGTRAGDVSDMPMVRLGEGESSASAALLFIGMRRAAVQLRIRIRG
jgi:hypothetical protein